MSELKNNLFKVSIFTPLGLHFSDNCESVSFWICDGKGKKDIGKYGVKKGHADAVFGVISGEIVIKKGEKIIFSAKSSDGFAVMDKGILKITVEKILE